MTKTQLLNVLSESTELQRKDVASVLDQLERHVKRRAVGTFTLPGPAQDQGREQARDKGAQDDLALHRPGDHGGRETRVAGSEGLAGRRSNEHLTSIVLTQVCVFH